MTLDERISRCWSNGNSIAETKAYIKRATGADLTSEDVRARFVKLADRFAADRARAR
jgi:hypothetical protein